MKKYLFLFDIDGTILKLRRFRSRTIFKDLFRDIFGVVVDDAMMPDFAGNTDLRILRAISEANSIPFDAILNDIDNIWKKILREFEPYCNSENLELLPGSDRLIARLSQREDVELALLTGNFRENAYLKLNAFGLGSFFPFGAFGSDHEDRNKLPAIALQRANSFFSGADFRFDSTNAIIIGDSPRDIECAKTNSMAVAAVATGGFDPALLKDNKADLVFENFTDCDHVIDSIFNLLGNR